MRTAMTDYTRKAMIPDPKARTMKVKLNHNSFIEGSEGNKGDIVEVDAALGKKWCDEKAAVGTKESVTPPEERANTPERKAALNPHEGA